MAESQNARSASDLLRFLSEKGHLSGEQSALAQFIRDRQQDEELPLYLRALVGLGAFIASICLMGLIAIGVEPNADSGFVIWGLVFIAIANIFHRLHRECGLILQSFLLQSSFAFMAAGKGLFVFGTANVLENSWSVSLAIFAITIATYFVYRLSVDRFLSCFALFLSILLNILWGDETALARDVLFNAFLSLQLLLAGFLTWSGRIDRDFVPLKYSLLFSLSAMVLFLAAQMEFGGWGEEIPISSLFSSLLLTLSLIAAIVWIVGGVNRMRSEPLLLSVLGTIALGSVSAPGVILSVILMLLGYARHERIMMTLGALLLPAFLWFYYYNLDISLFEKSGILVGSGIVLLAARFYLSFRKWDRGEGA